MTDFPEGAGPVLLWLARSSIATMLDQPPGEPPVALDRLGDWLREPGASFVTLTIRGDLRGCIGSLVAHRALREDIRSNAYAAAFDDPRFPPLSAREFERVRIEVSVLSAPRPLAFTSREDALAQLRPGTDGVILAAHGRRATFLPQVWDDLPEREEFIAHLMNKAGLPAGFWDDSVRIDRYTVTAFLEPPEPGRL